MVISALVISPPGSKGVVSLSMLMPLFTAALLAACAHVGAAELHVFPGGSDANDWSEDTLFQTIQAAANAAVPDDTITVHSARPAGLARLANRGGGRQPAVSRVRAVLLSRHEHGHAPGMIVP